MGRPKKLIYSRDIPTPEETAPDPVIGDVVEGPELPIGHIIDTTDTTEDGGIKEVCPCPDCIVYNDILKNTVSMIRKSFGVQPWPPTLYQEMTKVLDYLNSNIK